MIRRRLFAYTVMMTAGIASGFFIIQRTRVISGVLFILSAALAACFMLQQEARFSSLGSARARALTIKETILLTGFLIFGFMSFTFSYISFESDAAKLSEYGEDAVVTLTGTPLSVRSNDEYLRIEIEDAKLEDLVGFEDPASGPRHKILVTVRKERMPEELEASDLLENHLEFRGNLRKPSGMQNPGCFDYNIYLRSTGTVYQMKADCLTGYTPFKRGRWRSLVYRVRENFLDMFEDEQVRAFIKGSVFGDKSDIDEETREDFNTNNTGHILAVSGLHIGFLYALLRLAVGRRRSLFVSIIIIAVIAVYGEMTLWSASTIRAVLVLSISLISTFILRPFDLLSAVSAAAFAILASEPYQLFNTGFQMSFLALLGIAFITKPAENFTGESFAVMLAVQAGAAPVCAYCFHRFNPLSVLINVPVIAVASVLVPVCVTALGINTLGMITGICAGGISSAAAWICEAAAELTIRLNSLLAGDGGFSVSVTTASPAALFLFYLFAFLITSEWFRVRILRKEWRGILTASLCILLVAGCFHAASYNRFADDEIVFVSVGQGDCTHVRCKDHDVLIDGGGQSDYNVGKKILMPYLLANGSERVDIALVTHLHMDHYKGIYELTEEYPVGRIGIPADYQKSIALPPYLATSFTILELKNEY